MKAGINFCTSIRVRPSNILTEHQNEYPAMKAKTSLNKFLRSLILSTPLLGMPCAIAADYYWDINGLTLGSGGVSPSGTWAASGTTWSTDPLGATATSAYTTLSTDDLVFSAGSDARHNYTVTVNSAQAAKSITFDDGRVILSGTGSITLGASNFIRTVAGGTNMVIGNSTALSLGGTNGLTKTGAGALVISNTSTHGLTGGLTLNGGNLSVERNGANPFATSNTLTFGGGTLQFKTTGSGTLDQTFGNVTVNAGGGRLFVDSNGFVRAQVNLGTITATAAGGSLVLGVPTGFGSGAKVITTTSTNDATGILGGRIIYANGTATTGYDFARITSGTTVGAYAAYTALPLSGGSSTTNYNWTASSTLAGNLAVNTLKLAPTTANQTLALGTNLLTVESGGILTTTNATTTISGTAGGTRLTAGAGSNYDLIVHDYVTTTISAVIGNNGGNTVNFVKAGIARTELSGTNTYTGSTYINSGVLTISGSMTSFGGNARNIHIAPGAAIRTGTFDASFYGRLVQTNEEVGLFSSNAAANVDFTATGANMPNAFFGSWNGNNANFNYTGLITPANNTYRLGFAQGTGGYFSIGSGVAANALIGNNDLIVGGSRVVLVGTNHTFTGTTTMRTGSRLVLANDLALQNSILDLGDSGGSFLLSASVGAPTGAAATTSPVLGGLAGSRNLSAAFSNASESFGPSYQAPTAVTGYTLNVGAGKSPEYSGAIGGFGTGASGGTGGAMTLTKTGPGTQILTGTSNYTGATSITAGRLTINGSGSINSSSSVTINGATATLRYNSSTNLSTTVNFTSGTLEGTNWNGSLSGQTIGANKTISPGNSPGTATTGSQTWAAGGSYLWEINNATGTAGSDPGWDLENGTGTLDITASSGSKFNILVTSLTLANASGLATNFSDALSYYWIIADFASITGFAANAFNINTTEFDNPFTGTFGVSLGGVGAVPGDNSQIYLTYTAIPEPRAALLGGLGLLMLLRRRR
jgi:autotransporter-associated beta strand protein